MTDLEYIRSMLTKAELWGQVAEEAAELAQAALKMQRLCMPKNKPAKAPNVCADNLAEELIDVFVCVFVTGIIDVDEETVKTWDVMGKVHRWAERLRGDERA